MKYFLYDRILGYENGFLGAMLAGVSTGILTTTITYPLDLVHGRMAADMSKKPPAIVDKNL